LVPVIGLIQVGQQAMADRYAYIPLIGVFVMLVWGLGDDGRMVMLVELLLPASTERLVEPHQRDQCSALGLRESKLCGKRIRFIC
jgi:hypothetical protein